MKAKTPGQDGEAKGLLGLVGGIERARKVLQARKGPLVHKDPRANQAVMAPAALLARPAPRDRLACISSAMTPALPAIIAT